MPTTTLTRYTSLQQHLSYSGLCRLVPAPVSWYKLLCVIVARIDQQLAIRVRFLGDAELPIGIIQMVGVALLIY